MTGTVTSAGKRNGKAAALLQGAAMLTLTVTACIMGYGTLKEINAIPGQVEAAEIPKTSNELYGRSDGGYTAAVREYDGYIETFMEEDKLFSGDLALVNKANIYPFTNETDLVSIYDYKSSRYYVRDMDVLVERRIMDSLNGLLNDFYEETGLCTVNVVAGYRSYDYQSGLYMNSLETDGEEYTSRYIALPGTSEHHTGLAVDFSIYHEDTGTSEEYDGTGEYSWIEENSWRYGFVKRYSEGKEQLTGIWDEPWHFRYVGIPHARIMTQKAFCLEEYIDFLKTYPWNGEHFKAEYDGAEYEIYYCPGLRAYLPKTGQYTVSGAGDGFVVTIER